MKVSVIKDLGKITNSKDFVYLAVKDSTFGYSHEGGYMMRTVSGCNTQLVAAQNHIFTYWLETRIEGGKIVTVSLDEGSGSFTYLSFSQLLLDLIRATEKRFPGTCLVINIDDIIPLLKRDKKLMIIDESAQVESTIKVCFIMN